MEQYDSNRNHDQLKLKEMPDVSLRVLYTVNTSPQYILAKAPQKVPLVAADGSSTTGSPTKHGRVSLRACALAICRSSPELSPDATKDFSVYILDPLEDLMSKSRHGQSGGVAVGMGLLSTILSPYTQDTTKVTGTLVDCGQDEDALEVVVSLRQVAPPPVPARSDFPQNVADLEKTKNSSKRPATDQSCLTYNPLPLSFNERLFSSYNQPWPQAASKPPKEPRKPNPAHATRAHQLPTPYIGPPKRKYDMTGRNKSFEGDISSRESTAELSDLPASQSSDDTSYYGSSEPSSSDTLPSSDAESVASSSTIRPYGTTQPTDIGESAVMLAALSSVSSNPANTGVHSVAQGNVTPSPELVSFLRAYLAYMEAQQKQLAPASSIVSHTGPPPAESTVQNARSGKESDHSGDKENQKPESELSAQSAKELRPKSPRRVSPLGSSRANVGGTASNPQDNETPCDMKSAPASASGEPSRKRKLSNATPVDETAQTRRRASSVSQTKPLTEDLSGIRLNRGWGGLRVRSDGTLWGEKPPVASASASAPSSTKPNDQQFFFRSSSQENTITTARKGRFVVPDWAKGVPPPAPPPKPIVSDEGNVGGRGARSRKQTKSKSMSRPGGKGTIKRSVSVANDGCLLGPLAPTISKPNSASAVLESPRTSHHTSPRRPPVFAYTSPIGKSRLATLFQAFQTSPLRPSARKTPSSTPPKSAKKTPDNTADFSSLFTPTPSKTKTAPRIKPRQLFGEDEDDDVPPSPTPTKRNRQASGVAKATTIAEALTGLDPQAERGPLEGADELPSSLPIASSDDVVISNTSGQTPSISSESSVISFGRVHDWSSFDLPPSSPPPQSSPSLTPVDGSDLPCSDIPFSDLSEIDSPAPGIVSETEISNYPSPSENDSQPIFTNLIPDNMQFELDISQLNCMNVPDLDDSFASFFNVAGEEGASQTAAFEALQNGLGEEDFSEGWNLLNSLFNQIPSGLHMDGDAAFPENQSWLPEALDQALVPDCDENSSLDAKTDTLNPLPVACGDQDSASIAAANLQDLLNGCVV